MSVFWVFFFCIFVVFLIIIFISLKFFFEREMNELGFDSVRFHSFTTDFDGFLIIENSPPFSHLKYCFI